VLDGMIILVIGILVVVVAANGAIWRTDPDIFTREVFNNLFSLQYAQISVTPSWTAKTRTKIRGHKNSHGM
jgi:hypothetical protein